MASTREKNGKWYYRITVSGKDKTRYIERGAFPTKEEALEAGELHEKKLKYGDVIFIPTKMTYGALAEEWIKNVAPSIYKESTIKTHKKTLKNYILPVIRDYDISAVDCKTLQTMINHETTKHTWHGLDKNHSTLSKTFDYAIRAGYINKTPLNGLVMPQIRSVAAQSLKPSREQKACPKQLVNAIFDRFPEGHPCHIPLLLGYRCGLRLGEVYGLLIEDVDKVNKQLYVRRQIQYKEETNELYFSDPKYCNPGEYRVVDLDSDTLRVLLRHIDKVEKSRPVMQHVQYYETPERMVSTECGKPIYFLNVRPVDGGYISHHIYLGELPKSIFLFQQKSRKNLSL